MAMPPASDLARGDFRATGDDSVVAFEADIIKAAGPESSRNLSRCASVLLSVMSLAAATSTSVPCSAGQ